MTTVNISLYAIDCSNWQGTHALLNHSPFKKSPNPKEPGASEVTSRSEAAALHVREQPDAHAMPGWQKLVPPLKIQVKFSIQPDGMVTSAEAAQKINHTAKKGTSTGHAHWPHHFRRMLKMNAVNDSSCFRERHELINSCKAASFSPGRRAQRSTECSSMLNTTKWVEGPTHQDAEEGPTF